MKKEGIRQNGFGGIRSVYGKKGMNIYISIFLKLHMHDSLIIYKIIISIFSILPHLWFQNLQNLSKNKHLAKFFSTILYSL